ncbi:unnamed protein product [Urochloa decumbens]|uniref:Cytochrome P450 n=1 Tax=Urochloa decumbens TaxID=240449 RepID=A0ABC9ALV3_9POAL
MDSQSLCFCLLALLPILYFMKPYLGFLGLGSSNLGLQLPPGPRQLPILGSLHHFFSSELPHHIVRELSRRHGPLMFLKFGKIPVVVASSREAAMEVMKTHDAVFATRPQTVVAKVITKQAQALAITPYGDHWRQLRKIYVHDLLSTQRVRSFKAIREEEVARLIRAVSSDPAPLVNLSELLAAHVADTTVHAILGYRLRDRESFLRIINGAIELAAGFTLADLFPASWLTDSLSWTARRVDVYQEGMFSFLDSIVRDHVARRLDEEDFREGLLDILLRIHREGSTRFPLTMNTIKAVIFDLFAAGSETAAVTLQWAMAELMQNPTVMSKAQAEVREAFGSEMKVAEEGISNLTYLQWVIKETLRLHPPGPLLIPRECLQTCKVMNYDVPKGTMLIVNAWAISRDPRYWDEPETFKPERFEHDTREYKGNHFEFTPFGAGRRICPGMSFAIADVELALANLLFYFDWSLPQGVSPGQMDMTESAGITARRKKDLWLRATEHVQMSHI